MTKVLLGMSGGVDSAAAAWHLKRDGHEVVGVTFRFCDGPLRDEAVARTQQHAQTLGIQHHVVDMRERFTQTVEQHALREFQAGRFPNPCTVCTPQLKIPLLFEYADRFDCEKVATGHYANVTQDTQGFELLPYQLRVGLDTSKDQTFLLYELSQEQLARIVFPLANEQKGRVRRSVMQAGLYRIVSVNDGQGEPCFYGGASYLDWLEGVGALDARPGDMVDISNKSVVGSHDGLVRYEPGAKVGVREIEVTVVDLPEEGADPDEPPKTHVERREEELFAIAKDLPNNRLVVGNQALACVEACTLTKVHWTSIEAPRDKRSCRVKLSYWQNALPAQIVCTSAGVVVTFNEPVRGVRAGQPAVLYSDNLVLGGGIIAG